MSYKKPFHRNWRPAIDGCSGWDYITDREYSKNPTQYTRAFFMIQKDLQDLFEFVEPSDVNLSTYSHRIQQLMVRTCIEIEANFKAILRENIYNHKDTKGDIIPERKWNINDYKIINKTHRLSGYSVHYPYWNGEKNCFKPFANWDNNSELKWYQAYNSSKHDRDSNFQQATFENLLNSVAALLIVLTSQFGDYGFEPGPILYSSGEAGYYENNFGIGNFMLIDLPSDWSENEKYDFKWAELKKEDNRFEKINYDNL